MNEQLVSHISDLIGALMRIRKYQKRDMEYTILRLKSWPCKNRHLSWPSSLASAPAPPVRSPGPN